MPCLLICALLPMLASTITLPAGQHFMTGVPPLPSGQQLSLALGSLGECDTGGRLWPSALVLLRWQLRVAQDEISGKRILDLGCGTGAVGMFAAALGAKKVTLSDCQEGVLRLAETNRDANFARGLWSDAERVDVRHLAWGVDCSESGLELSHERYDLLLGSGVTYSVELHAPLCATLAALLEPGGRNKFICAHEKRVLPIPAGRSEEATPDTVLAHFLERAHASGLAVKTLETERQGGRLVSLLEVTM